MANDTKISKAVLITGCSSGIGEATALRLVKAGFPVYATARRPESLATLAEAGCVIMALDVTDEASMKAAVARVERDHGAVGVLINNAGYSQSGAVETLPMDRIRAQFETNVFGLIRLTQLALPGMRRQRWGRVINLSSMGGRLTFPGGGAYHASKYAVEAFSDALRFEVRGFGVRVVLVEPGLIRTGFSQAAVQKMGASEESGPYARFNEAVRTATVEAYQKGPLAALAGGPEDVAKVIHRAVTRRSPAARYTVTGSATVLLTQRQMMPDWAWDAFLRTQFPEPGVGEHAALPAPAKQPA